MGKPIRAELPVMKKLERELEKDEAMLCKADLGHA